MGTCSVSQPDQGTVKLVRPREGQLPEVFDWATGLRRPHDIVFHTVGDTPWVYVAETNQVTRSPWQPGETQRHDTEVVLTGLPDSSPPELQGARRPRAEEHRGRLARATSCVHCLQRATSCVADAEAIRARRTIYRYEPEGERAGCTRGAYATPRAWRSCPGADDDLWVTVNNRDNTPVPVRGRDRPVRQGHSRVRGQPPTRELTHLHDGGNYGWPFCNPNPDSASGL